MRLRSLALAALLLGCDKPQPPAPTPTNVVDASSAPLVTSSTPSASAAPVSAPSNMNELAKGSNALGFDLYARVRTTPGNLAMSPASISAALAMTYGGAKGETAAQMKKVMHFTSEPGPTMAAWGAATRSMKLRVANRLFGEKTYKFDAAFLDQTKAAFDAPLEPVDFKSAPDPTRIHINGWVEEQTEHRIKDLLPPNAIIRDTRLVLVNAIYFLASWETPFDPYLTRMSPFHLTASKEKKAAMMTRSGMMGLAKGDGARMVELNYKGATSALWIVLPDTVDGLAGIESRLNAATLDQWRTKLAPTNVELHLPSFEVNPKESLDLAKDLAAMGMSDAFDRKAADFTGIANPPDPKDRLYIANVFHKAFVKTDEKGTEAAAATAVSMGKGGGPPPDQIEFTVDRPFLFFVVDKASSLALFMGRVSDP